MGTSKIPSRPDLVSDVVEGRWRVINRVLIAALVLAAPVCLVSAQDAKVSVDMIGIGRMSCADWRLSKRRNR
jgi:hypothetical protein